MNVIEKSQKKSNKIADQITQATSSLSEIMDGVLHINSNNEQIVDAIEQQLESFSQVCSDLETINANSDEITTLSSQSFESSNNIELMTKGIRKQFGSFKT